jgi:hypothetical protein
MNTVFQREHVDAFLSVILDDLLDPANHPVADEQRARHVTYMLVAFNLVVAEQQIAINAIAAKTNFVLRTVSLGIKYLTDHGYLESTLVHASHGRGRAFEYTFSAKFVRKVMGARATEPIGRGIVCCAK